jgi:hypothetical protein
MGEGDRKGKGSSGYDRDSAGSKPPGHQGPLQLLVERFGEAGANAIYKRTIQRRRATRLERESAAQTQAAADKGISSIAGPLPHLDTIQKSFGKHDVSHVKAHTDAAAAEGSRAMGAEAFASGDHVAFAGTPALHTAAHEAAHVVQQRGGVQLKGGVGQEGDQHEQHADAVADKVVRGESAESMLDQHAQKHRPTTVHAAPSPASKFTVDAAIGQLMAAKDLATKHPPDVVGAKQIVDAVFVWMNQVVSEKNFFAHFGGHRGMAIDHTLAHMPLESLSALRSRLSLWTGEWAHKPMSLGGWNADIARVLSGRELLQVLNDERAATSSSVAEAADHAMEMAPKVAAGVVAITLLAPALAEVGAAAIVSEAQLVGGLATAAGRAAVTLVLTHPVEAVLLGEFAAGVAFQMIDSGGIGNYLQRFKTPMGALQATHDLLVVYLILRSNVGSQPVRLEAEIESIEGNSVSGKVRPNPGAALKSASGNHATDGQSEQIGNEGKSTGDSKSSMGTSPPSSGRMGTESAPKPTAGVMLTTVTGEQVIVDTNVARALDKKARGLPLQDGEKLMVASAEKQGIVLTDKVVEELGAKGGVQGTALVNKEIPVTPEQRHSAGQTGGSGGRRRRRWRPSGSHPSNPQREGAGGDARLCNC